MNYWNILEFLFNMETGLQQLFGSGSALGDILMLSLSWETEADARNVLRNMYDITISYLDRILEYFCLKISICIWDKSWCKQFIKKLYDIIVSYLDIGSYKISFCIPEQEKHNPRNPRLSDTELCRYHLIFFRWVNVNFK